MTKTEFNDVCASMFERGTRVTSVIMTQRVVDVDGPGWTAVVFNGVCSVAFAGVGSLVAK